MTSVKSLRMIALLALCALATVVASGCGSKSDKPGTGSSGGTTVTVSNNADGPTATTATVEVDDDLPEDLQDVAETVAEAGCSVEAPDEQEAEHVSDVDSDSYSSDPPSSGAHYDNWAKWGFYDDEVPEGYAVHNMEHGGVVVWYGQNVDELWRNAVRDDLLDDEEKWVVTPRDDVDGVVATAWGKLMRCDGGALDAMDQDTFIDVLDEWYDETGSTGTDAEGDLPAIPPAGDTSDFTPELPDPERDISAEALF